MYRRLILLTTLLVFLSGVGGALWAQETTKGQVAGTVEDQSGGVVPGARVILTGPQGSQETVTDGRGNYVFTNLTPGTYTLRTELPGFKAAEVRDFEVRVNERRTIRLVLEPGAVTEVVNVTGAAQAIDPTATNLGANLDATLYGNVPLSRNLSAIWYLAPGVSDGLGTGQQNPSISGATGLENVTTIDGVNLTNPEFGAVGTYNRVYGGLGTGINFDFIKEVQVQTGGFDARYGQALGGIVNIVTKSGTNEIHGSLAGYFAPRWLEANRRQPDDRLVNKVGENRGRADYDIVAEAGGYFKKDKFFWYSSINPTWGSNLLLGAQGFQLQQRGDIFERDRKLNMTGKLTYYFTTNHMIEGTYTADPSRQPRAPHRTLAWDSITGDLGEGDSELKYGSRNLVGRYNGTFTPRWVVTASGGRVFNKFDEINYNNNVYRIDNYYPTDDPGLLARRVPRRFMGSTGYVENTRNANNQFNVDSTHNLSRVGTHQISYGYQFEDNTNRSYVTRSGPIWTLFAGGPIKAEHVGRPVYGAQLRIRRASAADARASGGLINVGDPVYQQTRGSFSPSPPVTNTDTRYHSFYLQDTWTASRYFNIKGGVRWEQQQLKGDPNTLDISGLDLSTLPSYLQTREAILQALRYTFTGNWAPRVGFTVDPSGRGKMKIFANYGLFFEKIPLDLAIRSLSIESSYLSLRFRPDPGSVVIDPSTGRATITGPPRLDGAHYLRGGFLNGSITSIVPGTKSQRQREFLGGIEISITKDLVFGARFIRRDLTRIVEDMSGLTVQAAAQDGGPNLDQIYLIGNVGPQTDIFRNPVCVTPAGPSCAAWAPGSGLPGSDGTPDGFVKPLRRYQGVEFTLEKRFAANWQLHSNWRIGRLFGNYEGLFRNDNQQNDPNISSLFDFVASPQLGDQFAAGPLNSDRLHVVNLYVNRTFANGINVGLGSRLQSGVPMNSLLSHPAYLNAGEVPIGGRGRVCTNWVTDESTDPPTTRCTSSFEQRTPVTTDINLHFDYAYRFGDRYRIRPVVDLFNVLNHRKELVRNQFIEFGPGLTNVDFRQPTRYQRPFFMRAALRFEF